MEGEEDVACEGLAADNSLDVGPADRFLFFVIMLTIGTFVLSTTIWGIFNRAVRKKPFAGPTHYWLLLLTRCPLLVCFCGCVVPLLLTAAAVVKIGADADVIDMDIANYMAADSDIRWDQDALTRAVCHQEATIASRRLSQHDEGRSLQQARPQQTGTAWTLDIFYTAKNGDNVFTDECLTEIRDFERLIVNHAGYTDHCRRELLFANGRYYSEEECQPPDTPVNIFFMSEQAIANSSSVSLAYDGQGPLTNDIEGILLDFAENEVTWWCDTGFSITNLKSKYTRSRFNGGYPLAGYVGADDPKGVSEAGNRDYTRKLYDDVFLPTHSPDTYNCIVVSWYNSEMNDREILETLIHDSLWSIGSFIFVGMFLFAQLCSPTLVIFGMFGITVSFTEACYFYFSVAGYAKMSLLNFIALFLIMGIGADDILVMFNTYNIASASLPKGEDSTAQERMSWAYYRAGAAMLVTSATTMGSFYSLVLSDIIVVRSFGFFMGTIVACNYANVMIIFPAVILIKEYIHDCCAEYLCCCLPCCRERRRRLKVWREEKKMRQAMGETVTAAYGAPQRHGSRSKSGTKLFANEAGLSLVERLFLNCLAPFVTKMRLILILACLAVAVFCAYLSVSKFQTASGIPQVFVEERNLGRITALQTEAFSSYSSSELNAATDSYDPSQELFVSSCPGGVNVPGSSDVVFCNNHGNCNYIRQCECDSGYVGYACEYRYQSEPVIRASPSSFSEVVLLDVGQVYSGSDLVYVLNVQNNADVDMDWTIAVENSTWLTVSPLSGTAGPRTFNTNSGGSAVFGSSTVELRYKLQGHSLGEPQQTLTITALVGGSPHSDQTVRVQAMLLNSPQVSSVAFNPSSDLSVSPSQFRSTVLTYTVDVPYETDAIQIQAGFSYPTTAVAVNDGPALRSGQFSAAVPLEVQQLTEVTVTAMSDVNINGTYFFNFVRWPPGPPGLPTLQRVVSGDGSARVYFAPPVDTGGTPVRNYILVASPSSRRLSEGRRLESTVTVNSTGVATDCWDETTGEPVPGSGCYYIDAPGLTNGQLYEFDVSAETIAGVSAGSLPPMCSSCWPWVPLQPCAGGTCPAPTVTVQPSVVKHHGYVEVKIDTSSGGASTGGGVPSAFSCVSTPDSIVGVQSDACSSSGVCTVTVSGLDISTSYTFACSLTNAQDEGSAARESDPSPMTQAVIPIALDPVAPTLERVEFNGAQTRLIVTLQYAEDEFVSQLICELSNATHSIRTATNDDIPVQGPANVSVPWTLPDANYQLVCSLENRDAGRTPQAQSAEADPIVIGPLVPPMELTVTSSPNTITIEMAWTDDGFPVSISCSLLEEGTMTVAATLSNGSPYVFSGLSDENAFDVVCTGVRPVTGVACCDIEEVSSVPSVYPGLVAPAPEAPTFPMMDVDLIVRSTLTAHYPQVTGCTCFVTGTTEGGVAVSEESSNSQVAPSSPPAYCDVTFTALPFGTYSAECFVTNPHGDSGRGPTSATYTHATAVPTAPTVPTVSPTTAEPTPRPTLAPGSPTRTPTLAPSTSPTTLSPTRTPTGEPTDAPTTHVPTLTPTLSPTNAPTPTPAPTVDMPEVDLEGEGELSVDASITEDEMTNALIATLAALYGVPESAITIDSISGSRRLSLVDAMTSANAPFGGASEVGISRRLSTTWTYSFTITVPLDEADTVASDAEAANADTGGFESQLADSLEAEGVDAGTAGSATVVTLTDPNTPPPTPQPTPPTMEPTMGPTSIPTSAPTFTPTAAPTTPAPTAAPTTAAPTSAPTLVPTEDPTVPPTFAPTFAPTVAPTFAPTRAPTTPAPTTLTRSPTMSPTWRPTFAPTFAPTMEPTLSPTYAPTLQPTPAPTEAIPPGPPSVLDVTITANQELTLELDPSDEGSRATSFECQVLDDASLSGTSATPFVAIGGLQGGVRYSFECRASNSGGTSLFAASTSTYLAISSPSAPTVEVAVTGEYELTLTLTPPTTTGGATVNWYSCTTPLSSNPVVREGSQPVIRYASLTLGVEYHFQCSVGHQYRSIVGMGAPSELSGPHYAKTVPAAPQITCALPREQEIRIKVRDTTAVDDVTRVPVTSMECGSTDLAGSALVEATGALPNQAAVLSGFTDGEVATVWCRSTSIVGTGPRATSDEVVPGVAVITVFGMNGLVGGPPSPFEIRQIYSDGLNVPIEAVLADVAAVSSDLDGCPDGDSSARRLQDTLYAQVQVMTDGTSGEINDAVQGMTQLASSDQLAVSLGATSVEVESDPFTLSPQSSDSTLRALEVFNLGESNNPGVWTPPFDPVVTFYEVSVSALWFTVQAQATEELLSEVRLGEGLPRNHQFDITAAAPTFVTVEVTVQAADNSQTQYTLQVSKPPVVCSPPCNNGTCNELSGGCDCDEGYFGELCDVHCPDDCGGPTQGSCSIPDGGCQCADTFAGDGCDERVCPTCFNGGVCSAGEQTPDATWGCTCPWNYTGSTCLRAICPGNCTGLQGVCNTVTGVCTCETGFSGDDCSYKEPALVSLSAAVEISLVLGLKGHDPNAKDQPLYTEGFALGNPTIQQWIMNFTRAAREDPELHVRDEHLTWLEEFDLYLQGIGHPNCSSDTTCLPLPSENFKTSLNDWLWGCHHDQNLDCPDTEIQKDVGTEGENYNGEWRYARTRLRVNFLSSDGFIELQPEHDKWVDLVDSLNSNAPHQGEILMVSDTWTQIVIEQKILDSTLAAFCVSVGISLMSILMFTGNICISLYTVCAVILTIVILFGFITAVFKWEFGAVQAIGLTTFVGMSVDYTLHLAHAYHSAKENASGERWPTLRRQKMAESLVHIGPSILGGSLTTAGATVFLFPTWIFLFQQLGVMLFTNTLIAVSLTFYFLSPLLISSGPVGVCMDVGYLCVAPFKVGHRRVADHVANTPSRDGPNTIRGVDEQPDQQGQQPSQGDPCQAQGTQSSTISTRRELKLVFKRFLGLDASAPYEYIYQQTGVDPASVTDKLDPPDGVKVHNGAEEESTPASRFREHAKDAGEQMQVTVVAPTRPRSGVSGSSDGDADTTVSRAQPVDDQSSGVSI